MADAKPIYETADLPTGSLIKEGYNAEPHQIPTPPTAPVNSGADTQVGGNQGSSSSSSGGSGKE
jgi:hypothetical protein